MDVPEGYLEATATYPSMNIKKNYACACEVKYKLWQGHMHHDNHVIVTFIQALYVSVCLYVLES